MVGFKRGGFMRVKVDEVGAALHPSEVVVQVKTESGVENLAVDKRSLEAGTLSVGSPIGRNEKDFWLIELPRETMSGAWRVWVSTDSLQPEPSDSKVRAA
jgi:hypothetical protein